MENNKLLFDQKGFTWQKLKLAFLSWLFVAGAYAQNPSYKEFKTIFNTNAQLVTGASTVFTNVNPVATTPQLKYSNKSAAINFKLDLGEDYVKTAANWNFTVTVDVTYVIAAASITKTLEITQNAPEVIKTVDLLSVVNSNSVGTLPVSVTINSVGVTISPANPLLQNFISGNRRFTVSVVREYNTDVRYSTSLIANPLIINPVGINNRLVNFSWTNPSSLSFPNYEVQILKLYNSSNSFTTDLNQIGSDVDWNRALKVETQNFQNSVNLTMAEGTGYYLWRVRPVGTFYDGGIANSENYGLWSYALPTSTVNTTFVKNVLQSPSNPTPYAFYFTDPDENLNWIYSRVFTEGDNQNKSNPTGLKSSEGMNYANGLLMSRQSQKFNSSENTNIVSQTMIDYSGRPALSTIPVPLQGNLTGYKLDFVKNNSGALYTAFHFDDDSKLNSPDKVDNTISSNYAYYSQNATVGINNTNVPNAKGYPYKRTLFKSDGTNRVKEESGVGEAHALGLQTNGQGRTTRILYCTPSEDELIRIFGDEAPLAESVIKTITIDQNNVASASYTSKEGKTIATALISETNTNLMGLTQSVTPLTVTNTINNNVVSSNKIVSSKRIAIPTSTATVKLSYINTSLALNSGTCATGNCDFKMRFYIVDLTNNVTFISDAVSSTTVIDEFVPTAGFSFPATWMFASQSPTVLPNIMPTGATFDQITLPLGEYLFVKEVFSPRMPNYADSLINSQNEKTKPLIDALLDKMKTVNSNTASTAFNTFISGLRCRLDAYNSITPPCVLANTITSDSILKYLSVDKTVLPSTYTVPFYPTFSVSAITSNSVDPTLNDFSITSGCCGKIQTSIPKPPICYVCDGNPQPSLPSPASNINAMIAANKAVVYQTDSIIRYGFNDFITHGGWSILTYTNKLDAINDLVYHEFILLFKNRLASEGLDSTDLWKYVPGHNFTSLKLMLSNMLLSQYYIGNAVKHSGVWYAATYDPATNGYNLTTAVSALSGLSYNYDCKKLFEAWYANLEVINNFSVGGNDNILEKFNDSDGPNSGQQNGDDDENWKVKNKIVKAVLQKAVGTEMEEFSQKPGGTITSGRKEAATSFINLFMGEVGSKFYSIIDGGFQPDYIAAGAASITPVEFDLTTVSGLSTPSNVTLQTSLPFGATTYTNIVRAFSVTSPTTANLSVVTNTAVGCGSYNEMYYPYILKPEWQFKYFHYNVYSDATPFISKGNLILPNQVEIDLQTNYNLPTSYITGTTTLCQTPTAYNYSVSGVQTGTFNFTHVNWSSGQRQAFYDRIKSAPVCPNDKGVTLPKYSAPPSCPSTKASLYTEALKQLDETINNVNTRKGAIKSALQNELVASCYTIVPCKTASAPGIISDQEITIMVDSVINKTKALAKAIRLSLVAAVGSNSNTAPTGCTPYGAYTNSYGTSNCNLPTCTSYTCNEIVLDKLNQLSTITSAILDVKLFRDCDQKILNMINGGSFLPDIAAATGVGVTSPCTTKTQKQWKNANCLPEDTNCGNYVEKKTCSPSAFKTYSGTYTITATGN
ncbi:MAG: hypothetical protein H0W73_16920 [Bacteroidetes bacterium]|nr:hypothetical protein [Bacteroidota bacterium]